MFKICSNFVLAKTFTKVTDSKRNIFYCLKYWHSLIPYFKLRFLVFVFANRDGYAFFCFNIKKV